MRSWIVGGLIVVCVGTVLAIASIIGRDRTTPAILSMPRPSPDPPAEQQQPPPPQPAPSPPDPSSVIVDVTARQLYDDYRGNSIGADEKYKGKALRVIGIVDHVSREGADKAFLDFRVYRTERVQAHFESAHELASVKAGLEATVRCFGDGEFGGPQLKTCALEQ